MVQRRIHSDELYKATEVFLVGSAHITMPLTFWNERPIGDGTPGIVALALSSMMELDMKPRDDHPDLMQVPYGYMTGMRSQLV